MELNSSKSTGRDDNRWKATETIQENEDVETECSTRPREKESILDIFKKQSK